MRICKIVDFAVPVDHRIKLKINTLTLLEKKKTMEHDGDNCTNFDWCFLVQ